MTPGSRARFVEAYSKLVADVWSDPDREAMLVTDPRALLAAYDLELPDPVSITVVRDSADAEPDLEQQVRAWRESLDTGELTLYVPALSPITDVDLSDHELDDVVAGLDSSCACCCPCCCS